MVKKSPITTDKIRKICEMYISGYSIALTSEKLNIPPSTIVYHLIKENISRRNLSEAGYLSHLHRFGRKPVIIKNNLTPEEETLKIAGSMLYWAEGYKKNNYSSVSFSNSDPKMIKVFLRFLRLVCGVQEKRLRALLFLFKDQDELSLKQYWSKITKIPTNQFNASYVKSSKTDIGSYKRKSKYGTLLLRYSDKKLLKQILSWIEQYAFQNS